MPVPERSEALRLAARARHDATVARAEATLEALQRQARPVNFAQIAKAAGASRYCLYRPPQLRQKIQCLRGELSQKPPPSQGVQRVQRASANSLRQQLHVYGQELACYRPRKMNKVASL